MADSFGALAELEVGGRSLRIARLDALAGEHDLGRLPYTLRVLLENVLRSEALGHGSADEVHAVGGWDAHAHPTKEISFRPARVLLQDFTGVPAIVDLAGMREAMVALGGDPAAINPLIPAELVIDHSVQVDEFGSRFAMFKNTEREFERNRERYAFLRWGQTAFENFSVVPPNTGIVHQVNLEYLARVVEAREEGGVLTAFPDTLIGTDSHTTMVNGLGVLGWGVGGIEAEAVLLGEPVSMLVPQVVGFRLTGRLPEGATATDLVLAVTQILRKLGVVGKFVEYFGRGLSGLPLADRATIGNMSPEYGATCGFFPVDEETLRYLRLTGRSEEQVDLVERYCREQDLFHDPDAEPEYSQVVKLDLGDVEPSLAGPRRPQDRVALTDAKQSFLDSLSSFGVDYGNGSDEALAESFPASDPPDHSSPGHEPLPEQPSIATATVDRRQNGVRVEVDGGEFELDHGSVVIAAITSCTNTSNPSVMIAAGLLAKKAVERGLRRASWVKSSLAPGSKVVTEYYEKAGLTPYLEELGFHTVGYGCTTCIGNSGPLSEEISRAVEEGDLVVCAVLSGNRNFEARIHPEVKANYLASPPLVVAYAIAGRIDLDLTTEPLGQDQEGSDVFLRDLWPDADEVKDTIARAISEEMFRSTYADVFTGDEHWASLPVPEGDRFAWDPDSTYVRRPPYFDGMGKAPSPVEDVEGARCLVMIGDSVTTDHISPAGAIKLESPAGTYLVEHRVERRDFNSYGSRRGNHEVMVRGTFANVRLRNLLVPDSEGTWTVHLPSGDETTIFEAAERYREEGVPLVVLAGKEYGSGSSRDWAAKGPNLLGVRAVIAESYERIHRSNLIGMGILPLQYRNGENAASLGLTGHEEFRVSGVDNGEAEEVRVTATPDGGDPIDFGARVRIETPREREYLQHGGILLYALRKLAGMIHESAARGFARAPLDYERGRPGYPAEAIAFLVEALALGPGRRVLDLAAGTGKLTRRLAATGAEVVAVEPVDEMRALIEGEALTGTAEAIPLPDGAVDAVAVGQAFHWFRGDEALAEIHRVLRPRGRLGLVWNLRDDSDPLMAALTAIMAPHRGTAPAVHTEAWRDAFARTELFGPLEEAEFALAHELDHKGVVARVTSVSFIAALPPEEVERVVEAVRELVADEAEPLALRYRTLVYWCERR